MNKILLFIIGLTGFVFISCDFSDQPCYTMEEVTYCKGSCDFTITGKGNMKGAPWHIESHAIPSDYGYRVDVDLDRDDLVQECKQHDLDGSWCNYMKLDIDFGCSPQKVNTTCTDITGRVQVLYEYLEEYYYPSHHKTISYPDIYSQYLVSQGHRTLLKNDKEGKADTFSVTFTPNPKFVDFLKQYDLYMDYIQWNGSCSCKYTTGMAKVYHSSACGD